MGKPKTPSKGELLLACHLKELGLLFRSEMRISDMRKWRADFYLVDSNIIIEVEGGMWGKSRHGHGKGFEADCEKYNWATMYGYRVLRFSTGQVERGEAKKFLQEWLGKG